MMRHIDFEAKSDRELLILVAQKTNEIGDHLAILNKTVAKHESRLAVLDSRARCDGSPSPKGLQDTIKDKWQLMLGIVTLLSASLYAIGKACGWW